MDNLFGYVENDYKLNSSNGLYTCKLNYCNFIKTPTQSPQTPQTEPTKLIDLINTSAPTITQTIDLIPIVNTFGITSPNIPTQMVIMSRDSKFIFIVPLKENILATSVHDNKLMLIYICAYTSIKYNTSIPSVLYSVLLSLFSIDHEPTDDGIYSKLQEDTDKNKNLKNTYKYYLLAANPSPELLHYNSDTKIWKDVAYFAKTMYQYQIDKSIIPDTTCVDIKMDNLPTYIKEFDCRNVKDGTNSISPKYELGDFSELFKTNSKMTMIVIGIILCLCLCSSSVIGFMVLGKSSGRSRGGYQYYHY